MRILAIDHGTKLMGWAHIEDGVPISFGIHEMISDYPRTLLELRNRVDALAFKLEPDCMALERPMSLRGGDVAQKLIEHYAMAKVEAIEFSLLLVEVAPPTIKLLVAGAGNADKQTVAEALCIKYDLDLDVLCPPELFKGGKHKGHIKSRRWDASDAVALGIAAYEMHRKEAKTS